MRVRLTTDRAGSTWAQQEGDLLDLPDAEAQRLVAAGQAEPATAEAADVQTSAPAARKEKKR
jgi:hypothetical protein